MSEDDSDAAALLHEQADDALAAQSHERARELADEARALFVTACGEEHPDVASTDLLLSRIARECSDFTLALSLVVRAQTSLEAAQREYPEEPVVIELLAEAAAQHSAILISLGRYQEAERTAREVLPLAEQTLGSDAEAVAGLCNTLGMCHKYLANWEAAASHYARAVAILERIYGADAPELASLEHNLGGLAHARGEPKLAEPHARRSVALRERALGPDHPALAADLAAWAAILDDLGQLERAEAAYRRALAIFRRVHGEQHYEVGFTLGALGALFAGAERWDDARRELTQALHIQAHVLDAGHADLALLHHYLAVVEHARGALDAAARHAQQAVQVFASTFAPDHPRVIDSRQVQSAIARALAGKTTERSKP